MDGRDLAFAGLARQAELVADGSVSPRELVEACLQRIERLDPALNAFRVVYAERARLEADRATGRRGAGDDRPLLGVPVAVKDDMDVAGDVTAVGTGALGPPAAADSELVRRLRAAGAIVIGKTNVPELTAWPFTETAARGATRNPWALDRTPGGSSGGTGAAVAAGLVAAGTASDGLGSIRIPAACCGLFGLKPQRGRVPIGPRTDDAWHGLVHYGALTRSVADSALFLDVAADGAGGFRAAAARPPGALRVAVSTKVPPPLVAPVHPRERRAVRETADVLRSLGHTVVERDPDHHPGLVAGAIARYLRGIHDDARRLGAAAPLERRTRGMARMGALVSPAVLRRAGAAEAAGAARIGRLWDDVDVLLTPALAHPQPRVGAYEGRGAAWTLNGAGRFVAFFGVWNATGQPAACVPAGFDGDGLPMAVQLVARRDDEATLLSLAAQLEAERPWADRRPAEPGAA